MGMNVSRRICNDSRQSRVIGHAWVGEPSSLRAWLENAKPHSNDVGRLTDVATGDRRMMTDQDLLHRIAAGDRSAFTAFYDRYAPSVWGLVSRILHRREDAEDTLQT